MLQDTNQRTYETVCHWPLCQLAVGILGSRIWPSRAFLSLFNRYRLGAYSIDSNRVSSTYPYHYQHARAKYVQCAITNNNTAIPPIVSSSSRHLVPRHTLADIQCFLQLERKGSEYDVQRSLTRRLIKGQHQLSIEALLGISTFYPDASYLRCLVNNNLYYPRIHHYFLSERDYLLRNLTLFKANAAAQLWTNLLDDHKLNMHPIRRATLQNMAPSSVVRLRMVHQS